MIVGIDLGTTNSLIAVWKEGASHLIPNALGSFLTPSAVSVDKDGQILVGMSALERSFSHPEFSAVCFKRNMGTNKKFEIGRQVFRPEELSSIVLRSLKRDAEAYLGETISEAVITVPAYFNDTQRKATKVAGELAGLKVERLLNEPTAAAMAYGLHQFENDCKIMVVDLGGGTFDVSILEKFEGIMEVRAIAGDNFMGGEDFVEAIMERFMEAAGKEAGILPRHQNLVVHAILKRQAENAKKALTQFDEAAIEVVWEHKTIRWVLNRTEFELIAAPFMQRIRLPIERSLRDANIRPDEINHIVLAGGATRMPIIKRLIATLFKKLPTANLNPDEVVAKGAAIQAGLKMNDRALEDVVFTDVAPYSLGIETASQFSEFDVVNGLFSPIIERGSVVP